MYEITIHKVFCAAHALRMPDGSMEPLHGHNWNVSVTVSAGKLDKMECVMDFHALEAMVNDVLGGVDNANLNELPPFRGREGKLKINPSAERVAWWIGEVVLDELPKGVKLVSVSVTEAPGCTASYRPGR